MAADDKQRGLSRGLQRHGDPNLNRVYSKTAADGATMLETLVDRVAAGDVHSLRLGMPEIDAAVRTMWPGSVTVIVGRPSHRKSSTLKHMARLECERIVAAARGDAEVVVYVTLEEPEEEVFLRAAGAPFGVSAVTSGEADTAAKVEWSDRIASLPLVTVGHHRTPISRALVDVPPRLTIEQAYREVEQAVEDDERQPTGLFVDYLQKAATETRTENERTGRVAYVVGRLVDVAKRLDVPAVVAAQAGRQVDERVPPIPAIGDLQWSSQLEQDADVVLSCWYPHKTELETRRKLEALYRSKRFSTGSGHLTYEELVAADTMVFALRKQRYGEATGLWACKVDPASGALSAWPRPEVRIGGRRD